VLYLVSLDWVVERVKNLSCSGVSCEGFKDQLLALFTTIKASWHQNGE